MKNKILHQLILVFSVILCGFSHLEARDVNVYFSPKGGAQAAVKKHLLNADRNIDIAMYNFSSSSIFDALKEVRTRRPEVKIRVIFDRAWDASEEKPEDTSKYDQSEKLEAIGIDVRYVKNKSMHHKFFIVDGFPDGLKGDGDEDFSNTVLFTGSGNFSDSADSKYDENYLEVTDEPYLTTQFQKEYQRLWAYSYDFPSKETFEKKEEYDGDWEEESEFDVLFTSWNFDKSLKFKDNGNRVASRALEKAISRAKDTIYVASDHFRFVAIAKALVEAKKRKPELEIRVLIDGDEYATQSHQKQFMSEYRACVKNNGEDSEDCLRMGGYKMSRWLSDNDIEVRSKYFSYIFYYARDPQMHNKYLIIDGKDVWTGSYNYSISAEFKTLENLIHIPGREFPQLADSFTDNFKKMWDLNRSNFYTHKRELKTRNRIPLHFSSMALDLDEIDELRSDLNKRVPGFFNKAKPEHIFWDVKRKRGIE